MEKFIDVVKECAYEVVYGYEACWWQKMKKKLKWRGRCGSDQKKLKSLRNDESHENDRQK